MQQRVTYFLFYFLFVMFLPFPYFSSSVEAWICKGSRSVWQTFFFNFLFLSFVICLWNNSTDNKDQKDDVYWKIINRVSSSKSFDFEIIPLSDPPVQERLPIPWGRAAGFWINGEKAGILLLPASRAAWYLRLQLIRKTSLSKGIKRCKLPEWDPESTPSVKLANLVEESLFPFWIEIPAAASL